MWTNAQLKQNAWRILQRDYWMPFLITFLYGMIVGAATAVVSQLIPSFSGADLRYYNAFEQFTLVVLLGMLTITRIVLSCCTSLFLDNIMEVGLARFFMQNRGRRSDIGTLFSAYGRNFRNVAVVQFLRQLFTFLWSLALVIPGMIKGYEYAMIPYLLAENPSMPYQRAFQLSRMMTQGYKMDMFLLDLSFIGWYLLGLLPCGLGLFFVAPYHRAAHAEQYTALRTRALSLGLTTPYELPGFGY